MHRQPKLVADGAVVVRGGFAVWVLLENAMSLGQKTRAAQRLVFSSSLSHSNAKFAVPPCALGFGTKDDSLAKSPPSFRLEETLPPTN